MATELEKVINCLEGEIKALTLLPQVPLESLIKIQKGFKLITTDIVQSNGSKRKMQRVLDQANRCSPDFFVLCVLSTTQSSLNKLKWTRQEITAICDWWKGLDKKPVDVLRKAFQDATQDSRASESKLQEVTPASGSPDVQVASSPDVQVAGSPDVQVAGSLDVQVAGSWVRDAMRGKEDDKFWLRRDSNGVWTIEVNDDVQRALIVMSKMRDIVRM